MTFKDTGDTTDDAAYTAETKAYARIPSGSLRAGRPRCCRSRAWSSSSSSGQGKVDAKGCEDDVNADGTPGKLGKCIGGELPVDLGIPGLSLKTGDGGSVKGSVGWNLDLKHRDEPQPWVLRQHQQGAEPARVPGRCVPGAGRDRERRQADLAAQLAIINVDADKNSATPEFVGQFGIDIKDDPNDGATDFDLTVAEMKRLRVKDVIVVTVRAQVDINWHLAAGADAALPGISTDFRLTWAWGLPRVRPRRRPTRTTSRSPSTR